MNELAHDPALELPEARAVFDDVSFSITDRDGRRKPILTRFDLEIHEGETVVLVGRSGAGKTTILKLANRLLDPSGGEVRVAGRPTVEWDPVELRRGIGYVIQEIGLFPHFSVARNVGLVPELVGWERGRVANRVNELLDRVGLPPEEFSDRLPHQLSGGQRQRVGVARALAADPPLLLLDEPFGALDPMTRTDLQQAFRELMRRLGKAVLFVTHDVREALIVGDRIGVIEEGRLVYLATVSEFVRADVPVVRGLLDTLARLTPLEGEETNA